VQRARVDTDSCPNRTGGRGAKKKNGDQNLVREISGKDSAHYARRKNVKTGTGRFDEEERA